MKTSLKIIHWLPRILCIFAILFISMFAGDAFEHGNNILQKLGAFFIHLIPSLILVILLIIAWKWELIGGIIFITIGLGFIPFIFNHNFNMNQSIGMTLGIVAMINMPFVLVGLLFLSSYRMKKKFMA